MTVKSQPQTRRHATCHRHPSTPVTGFCSSCLRERLAGIEAAAAAGTTAGLSAVNKSPSAKLRRSKSCSEGPKSDDLTANLAGVCDGGEDSRRRKSCDVGPRGVGGSSLWSLFNRDDERKGAPRKFDAELGTLGLGFDLKGEEEREANGEEGNEEARVSAETKTMKELIDLEWTRKKSVVDFREIAGTFWEKASGLSKKLIKWKRKAKSKKKNDEDNENENENDNEEASRRETQSEVGEYGLGRRSCDADPRRFSVDDCRRFSFDEPRPSWDARLPPPPMAAVTEDNETAEPISPGGTEQTRDYYSSFDRRSNRRSFDCGSLADNAKVSPATTELFYGVKLLIADTEASSAAKNKPLPLAPPAKKWNIWGNSKKEAASEKLLRSYSVSCQNQGKSSNNNNGGPGGLKNRSVRYSPSPSNAAENGLLRFYLTPLRSHGRRSGLSRRASAKNVL